MTADRGRLGSTLLAGQLPALGGNRADQRGGAGRVRARAGHRVPRRAGQPRHPLLRAARPRLAPLGTRGNAGMTKRIVFLLALPIVLIAAWWFVSAGSTDFYRP